MYRSMTLHSISSDLEYQTIQVYKYKNTGIVLINMKKISDVPQT